MNQPQAAPQGHTTPPPVSKEQIERLERRGFTIECINDGCDWDGSFRWMQWDDERRLVAFQESDPCETEQEAWADAMRFDACGRRVNAYSN